MLGPLVLLAFVCLALSAALWRRRIGSGVAPSSLYAMIWGGVWLIHWTDLMDYDVISDETLLLSGIPLLAMLGGDIIAGLWPLKGPSSGHPAAGIDTSVFRKWIIALGSLSVVSGVVICLGSYLAFGAFWSSNTLKAARVAAGLGIYDGTPVALLAKYAGLLQATSIAGCILGALYLNLVDRSYWPGVVLPLLGALLYDFGWASRVNSYYVIINIVVVWLFMPKVQISGKPSGHRSGMRFGSILAGCLLVAGSVAVLNAVTASSRGQETEVVEGVELPLSAVQLIDYQAATLVCFDKTREDAQRTWGRLSFWGVEQWLRLLRIEPEWVQPPRELLDWELQYAAVTRDAGRPGNVFTWLRYLYTDFGPTGLVVLPGFLAAISSLAAKSLREKGRDAMAPMVTIAICNWIILQSPTIASLRNEEFVFAIALLAFAVRRIRKSPATARAHPGGSVPEYAS